MAARATAALAGEERLLLTDLVLAECAYVLESFYEVPRSQVARLMRAALALPTVQVLDSATLLRALEVYELDRLDFAEALRYLTPPTRSCHSSICRPDPSR